MTTSFNRFEHRVAVVTGAGRGMGRRLAVDLASEGARVAVTDIDAPKVEEVTAEIKKSGGQCVGHVCDVSDSEAVSNLVLKIINNWGRIDILVNNAGLLLTGDTEGMTDDIIRRTLDINVAGVLYFIRAVTPLFKNQRYGKIINVSSITGKNGDNSTYPVYGASKGAVISLTRSIARELGPFNVNCNAIAPHAVMTDMMSYWDDEKKSRATEKIPIGRLGTVEDMSSLIRFLASDESSFITGETININGGFYMD